MKKFYFGVLLGILSCVSIANAQQRTEKKKFICGNDDLEAQIRAQYPDYQKQIDRIVAEAKKNGSMSKIAANDTFIIPVVFHVIHTYGSENISDDVAIDGIRVINTDFGKRNADTSKLSKSFISLASDVKIRFQLAKKDPKGECTTGVEHLFSRRTKNATRGTANSSNLSLQLWDHNKYMNVWVITMYKPQAGQQGIVLANATLAQFGGFNVGDDGVMTRSDAVGSKGAQGSVGLRTLTHELGHFFNLQHTWGGGQVGTACGDDGVADTPPTKGYFSTCPGIAQRSICDKDVEENTENYMDYAACTYMFTKGQVTRMQNAMNTYTWRMMWKDENLVATGLNAGFTCTPKPMADMKPFPIVACVGSEINLGNANVSWGGPASTYQWTVSGPNGTFTSNSADGKLTINKVGQYDVTLRLSNSTGSSYIKRKGLVIVRAAVPEIGGLFSDDFETDKGWNVVNEQDSSVAWSRVVGTGIDKSSCYRVNLLNLNHFSGIGDHLISPKFNLSTLSAPKITFKTAYAVANANASDVLKVFVSDDCGTTWIQKGFILDKSRLTPAPSPKTVNGGYIPTDNAEWKTQSIDISDYSNSAELMVRLTAEGGGEGGGNHLYVDDFNISGVLGIDNALARKIALNIYPNPSNTGESTVSFNLNAAQNVNIAVYDVLGKVVSTLQNGKLNAGAYDYAVNLSSKGVYIVKVTVDNQTISKKLVIQ